MQYSKTSAAMWKIVSTGLKTEKPVILTEKKVIKLIRSEIISGGAQVYNYNATRDQWMRLSETYLNNYVMEVQKINELQEIERREARAQKAELRRKNTTERRKVVMGTLGKLAGRISPVDLFKRGVVGLFYLFCVLCFGGFIYGVVIFSVDYDSSAMKVEREAPQGKFHELDREAQNKFDSRHAALLQFEKFISEIQYANVPLGSQNIETSCQYDPQDPTRPPFFGFLTIKWSNKYGNYEMKLEFYWNNMRNRWVYSSGEETNPTFKGSQYWSRMDWLTYTRDFYSGIKIAILNLDNTITFSELSRKRR